MTHPYSSAQRRAIDVQNASTATHMIPPVPARPGSQSPASVIVPHAPAQHASHLQPRPGPGQPVAASPGQQPIGPVITGAVPHGEPPQPSPRRRFSWRPVR